MPWAILGAATLTLASLFVLGKSGFNAVSLLLLHLSLIGLKAGQGKTQVSDYVMPH